MTTLTKNKYIAFDQASAFFDNLKQAGKTIVQCHGTFDLIHPGHIYHFEEAKELGDVLVVTITSETYVNKGPGRPFFNDTLRVKSLTALECVDYVVVIPHPAAVEAIECVKPHYYCKGKEYQNTQNDPTNNILDDIKAVESAGGEMRYIGSVVFSSTKLINQHFDVYPPKVRTFCKKIRKTCSPENFREIIDSLQTLNVLIVGDIIFDRYTSLQVQGLASKNRILSGRFIEEETQAGGALAVLRHIKNFTANVKLIGLVGDEPWVPQLLSRYIDETEDEILRIPHHTTTIKQRFVEFQNEEKELLKYFSTNYINQEPPSIKTQNNLIKHIYPHLKEADLVLLMDFGHGVLENSVREFLQEKSKALAVNCQTNSSNYGFNIINKRYQRADFFTLDATELKLATGHKDICFSSALNSLHQQLNAHTSWLTRGDVETLGIGPDKETCICPALESRVVDTIGAGDAFCALTSLAWKKGVPLDVSGFAGQLAGSEAVKIIGNAHPIKKGNIIKSGATMLQA